MSYVFVYGSLKSGFENHAVLGGCEMVTRTRTKAKSYEMVSLDHFPAVILGGKNAIEGELYSVDVMTMAYLDMLEGNGYLYDRKLVDLKSGHKAWMYCLIPGLRLEQSQRRVLTLNDTQSWMPPVQDKPDVFRNIDSCFRD